MSENFRDLGLNDLLVDGIDAMGFSTPTPVQQQAIPHVLAGKDIVATAQTGTGKTAAYLLPIMQLIRESTDKKGVKALVIAPTRELVIQIDQQIEGLGYFTDVSSIAVYGGKDASAFDVQKHALLSGVDIVVATPGRLLIMLSLEKDIFNSIEYLILDEADRMMDMGFIDDILRIIKYLPEKRQTLLFSATMQPKVKKLIPKILHHPVEVSVANSKTASGVVQEAFLAHDNQKKALLEHILKQREYQRALIFTSTKIMARDIARIAQKYNDSVSSFQSDLEQHERTALMRDFISGETKVLVATDILSRGIDIDTIDLVINYDVPDEPQDYVHRVGRTARAERTGIAITFINEKDIRSFNRIESLIGIEIDKTNELPDGIGTGPQYHQDGKSKNGSGTKKKRRWNKGKPKR